MNGLKTSKHNESQHPPDVFKANTCDANTQTEHSLPLLEGEDWAWVKGVGDTDKSLDVQMGVSITGASL